MKTFKIVSILPISSKQYRYVVYKRRFLCWKKFRVYRSSIDSVIKSLCAEFINPKIYIELNNKDIENCIGKTNTRSELGRTEIEFKEFISNINKPTH